MGEAKGGQVTGEMSLITDWCVTQKQGLKPAAATQEQVGAHTVKQMPPTTVATTATLLRLLVRPVQAGTGNPAR